MRLISSFAIATAVASLLLGGSAFAQTAATPAPAAPAAKMAPATPATKMAPAKAKPERTAASLECSSQADAKGLKGKERKKFRSECKHDATKTDATKAK